MTGIQFIYFYACYHYSQKFFFIPYEIRKILIMLITGTILSFSSLIFNQLDLLPRLILKTAGVISFPLILYCFNFYEPVELQAIKGIVSKWSNIRNLRSNLNSLKGITDED